MTWQMGLAVGAAVLAVAGGAEGPVPVRGEPLPDATGLRLLVADDPPFVLDVDSGRIISSPALEAVEGGTVWVVALGGRAGVVVADSRVFGVRGRSARVTSLGTALDVIPSADAESAWLKVESGRGCSLGRFKLDRTPIGERSRVPCDWVIQAGGAVGVVARRTTLIEPATGRVLYRSRWGIVAVAGQKVVLAGPGRQFTLVDVRTGATQRLRWPSVLRGLDRPAVDPRGRYVVLAFADPAWPDGLGGTAGQALDAWLLDTRTGELTHVPGMPALVGLKATSMEWTSDGRLVLLGESSGRNVVGVWRPGEDRLAVKPVRLPMRTGGSDSFAPLR